MPLTESMVYDPLRIISCQEYQSIGTRLGGWLQVSHAQLWRYQNFFWKGGDQLHRTFYLCPSSRWRWIDTSLQPLQESWENQDTDCIYCNKHASIFLHRIAVVGSRDVYILFICENSMNKCSRVIVVKSSLARLWRGILVPVWYYA